MKKYIFTANVIALLLLVPATLVAYLHNTSTGTETKSANQELVKQSGTGFETISLLKLVKSN